MSLRTVLLLLLLPCAAHAQLAPAPDASPRAPFRPTSPVHPTQGQDQTQAAGSSTKLPPPSVARLNLNPDWVDLYFLARGSHDKPIAGLTSGDCAVYEDNKQQIIKSFLSQSSQPLTLGLLLDTGLSQQSVLPAERQATSDFLHRILQPKDEAFLIGFNVDVTLLNDFTSSPRDLQHAMDSAHVNSISGNYANGTIPSAGRPKARLLYDAVYLAAHDKLRHEVGRKVLILLTDGEDEGSRTRLQFAVEAAQKANAIVYVLLIRAPGIYGTSNDYDDRPMRKLAQATGGRVFKIGANGRKMQAAFEEIESDLRLEYQVSYTPSNSKRDGSYRAVHIECRQGGKQLHVQTRRGYYAERE